MNVVLNTHSQVESRIAVVSSVNYVPSVCVCVCVCVCVSLLIFRNGKMRLMHWLRSSILHVICLHEI